MSRGLEEISLLSVVLAAGCTAHGEPSPNPAPVQIEDAPTPPLEPEPEPEPTVLGDRTCIRRGPTTPLIHKPFAGELADVTGDGQPDVVALAYVGGSERGLVILTGQDDGRFDEGSAVEVDGTGLALGDLDGDEDVDALVLSGDGKPAYRVANNRGDGTFDLGARRRIPGRYGGELLHASLVDLDDDGDLDAVVPLWDSLRVLENRGDGRFTPGQRLAVGRDPFSTALADFDGDGHLDLVAMSGAGPARDRDSYHSSGSALWFFRGRARGFDPAAEPWSVSEGKEVAVADLDGDGLLEVVATRAWGISVLRDPRFWSSSGRWPAAPSVTGPWLREGAEVGFQMGTDGRLLIADLGQGPRPITSSFMQGRLNVALGPHADQTTWVDGGSFVVGLSAGSIAPDDTLPDLVVLNAGPPAHSVYGEPGSSIVVFFVDCPAPDRAG